jgi:hypothetical protein
MLSTGLGGEPVLRFVNCCSTNSFSALCEVIENGAHCDVESRLASAGQNEGHFWGWRVSFRTYMERIAVPQPTSRTTLSLKMCLFCMIAFMYDRVRTSSFCSHGNNLVSKCSILQCKGWWGRGAHTNISSWIPIAEQEIIR